MGDMKLGPIETRFAEIIWANAPLTTNQLTKLCAEALQWKRTTTYTVLKKLCEKGLFKTENSMVTVLISRGEFEGLQSEQFLEETFREDAAIFASSAMRLRFSLRWGNRRDPEDDRQHAGVIP